MLIRTLRLSCLNQLNIIRYRLAFEFHFFHFHGDTRYCGTGSWEKYEAGEKQKDPENCIEKGIEWLNDTGFVYCISLFSSEYSITYTYGTLSIIYIEKADHLDTFWLKDLFHFPI